MQCTTLQVPLDYDFVDEGNITLGISRYLARDPSKRIGNLFYNPGGPGGVSTDEIASAIAAGAIKSEILESFDIIAVDVRGSGRSSPLRCSPKLYNLPTPWYTSDEASFTELEEKNTRFCQSCVDLTGTSLVDYLDTVSIAKDHELVRLALGNESVNWLGQSYGT